MDNKDKIALALASLPFLMGALSLMIILILAIADKFTDVNEVTMVYGFEVAMWIGSFGIIILLVMSIIAILVGLIHLAKVAREILHELIER